MKKFFLIAILIYPVCANADTASVPASTATPTAIPPAVSTITVPFSYPPPIPTIADYGETISTPAPRAMTLPRDVSFITLTRTPLPSRMLPANVDVVNPEDARKYDAQNAGEMLTRETGVLIQPKGSSAYPLTARIRGASPDQTLVLIDGRPMEGTALGPADLSEIPIEQIDHIEIVRGGASSLYGPNAMAGVINVISKRAVYQGYPISHVSYEAASYYRQNYKLDFGARQGPVDYFFYGDQEWESGFRSNSDNSQYNIGGNAGVSMGKAGKLIFDASSFHNNAGVPGFRCADVLDPLCLTSTAPLDPSGFNNKDEKPASTPVSRQVRDDNSLRTSYLVDLPHDMFLAARFFGSSRETDFDDSADPVPSNATSFDRREHSKGGDVQLNLPCGLLAGASYTHDEEDFEDRLNEASSFSGNSDNTGLFAQETWQWRALTLIPSGRFDQNSQYGNTANPNVQGMIAATDWLSFTASGGRSFRAPTLDEAHLDPNLNPEKAWTYEAGFVTRESSRTLKVNYFRANVGDEIQSSSFTADNVATARRQGFEIQIDHTVNEFFRDGWNYTYLQNIGIPAGFNHWVALADSPRDTVNFYAVITPNKKWEFDPTMRYESSRFSGNDNTGTKMGSQFVMDVRMAYEWRQMELYLGINDLLDKRYEEEPGFPLPGRTVYAGIRLRLWG